MELGVQSRPSNFHSLTFPKGNSSCVIHAYIHKRKYGPHEGLGLNPSWPPGQAVKVVGWLGLQGYNLGEGDQSTLAPLPPSENNPPRSTPTPNTMIYPPLRVFSFLFFWLYVYVTYVGSNILIYW